ncbi:MAG: phosphatidylinositol alpha-1,6-mannosyltransferase [Alcanivorax sp.]|jgi:phosphatidylinositol alpha-1,6-mannosyltransferase
MNKPSVILIARNYPPLIGGIENMMAATLDILAQDYKVTLVGPNGCLKFAPNVSSCYQLPQHPALFLLLGLLITPLLVLRHRPIAVIGSNGVMAPMIWLCARLAAGKSFLFLHGRDIVSYSRIYRLFMWPFCKRMDAISVNSRNTEKLAVEAGISEQVIFINYPCIRRPTPLPDSTHRRNLKNNLGDYLLYAGRIVPRKGLLPFLENCGGWLKSSGLKLIIVGDLPIGQAGGIDRSYLDKVRGLLGAQELEQNVQLVGQVSDEEMASYMQFARVHIMPLIEEPGDVEGFGMVAVEAASYGTATVAFNCGGVSDAVLNTGLLVQAENYPNFLQAVETELSSPSSTASELIQWSHRFFEDQYAQTLKQALSNTL